MRRHVPAAIGLLLLVVSYAFAGGSNYKNFDVASYARVMDVQEMKDPAWLERNWGEVTKYVKFDYFQACGFNLETQPTYFDEVYSGTETRDPINNGMHIQQYHGYSIYRYLENLNHNNRGGWVDRAAVRCPTVTKSSFG